MLNALLRLAESPGACDESKFAVLCQAVFDGILVHDSGTILEANEKGAAMFGTTPDAIVGRSVFDFTAPEWRELIERNIRAADNLAVESVALRVDGTRFPVEVCGVTIPGTSQRVVALRDITARRAAAEMNDLFRTIIETAADFISIIEPSGAIRYPSPSIETLLGHAREAVTGRPFVELVHPEDAAAAVYFLDAQRRQPDANEIIALRLRHAGGAWRHFEVAAKNVLNDGRVTAIVATARDITERKLLEKQLEQAQRLTSLGRLAATVAHEFNNVLMGMAPFAELMQRPSIAGDVVQRGARHIAASVVRGKRIVQDLLRFTQPAEPNLEPLHLARWWETLGTEMRAMLANHITIATDLPRNAPAVIADGSQLAQVFANLVANARDAMPRGGTLTIRAEQPVPGETYAFGVVQHPESFTHISVADTGSGIAPEFINHVFDPLFTTKTSGGTGLGLAVAHQVITRAGGHIFVESKPGSGAVFHIFLRNAAVAAPIAHEVPAPSCTTVRRLLIVEDELPIIEGVTALFADDGVEVDSVTTGEEAPAAVDRFHPDVVLMDVTLPGIDGIEAYRRIRRHHPVLPIVFATGHGDGSKISSMLADGHTRFLQKPFELSALLDVIAELEGMPG